MRTESGRVRDQRRRRGRRHRRPPAAVAALPLSPARRLAVCSLPVSPPPGLVREREREQRGEEGRNKRGKR
uniref:Uncharacterized protein n=1 Tax=Oryza nivara TaxID=4536 RepID=A0A0E0J1M3_ORYNI